MMHAARQSPMTPAPLEPAWAEAHIAIELDDGNYLLDDGRLAQQAMSCLVTPALGDRVLVATCRHNEHYVVHLLSRPRGGDACVSVPGAERLAIRQAAIELNATGTVSVRALGDVDVTSATGVLSLSARNLFTTVSESLVENVRHYVGNIGQYLLDVKHLLRLHGKQVSLTAEQDVKVDGERISMG